MGLTVFGGRTVFKKMHSREKAIPGAAERGASGLASVSVSARGMHCHGCEHIIKVSVGKLSGVHKVEADYPTEMVSVAFDSTATNSDEIRAAIERAGYRVVSREKLESRRSATWKLVRLIAGVAGILLIIFFFDTEWISQGGAPDIGQHMSLQLIFLLGLLTGFHCIGMCGGFVLSYTAEDASEGRSSFLSQSRPAPAPRAVTRPAFQTITMDVISSGFSPNHFTIVKDVPVEWIINGKHITTCNSRIIVPSLKLEINVKEGRQAIEFTPRATGVIPWSCWKGMLHGEFEVIEAPIAAAKEAVMASQSSASPGESNASPQAAAPLPQRTAREFYTVVAGDSLRSIAAKFYHDARKWRQIAAANPGLDARSLRRGQIIRLPRTDTQGRNAREIRPRH